MLYCKKLAVLAMCVSLLTPLEARTRKGDRLFAQGHAAEVRKQYDQALDFYEQALSEDPADSGYQLADAPRALLRPDSFTSSAD